MKTQEVRYYLLFVVLTSCLIKVTLFLLMLAIPMCLSIHVQYNVSVKPKSFYYIKCYFMATYLDFL